MWLREHDLHIDGFPVPSGGLHILADFQFGGDSDLGGIFLNKRAFSLVLKSTGWLVMHPDIAIIQLFETVFKVGRQMSPSGWSSGERSLRPEPAKLSNHQLA